MEVQSRMKRKWNLQSLHLRFGHSGMGLFQFQGPRKMQTYWRRFPRRWCKNSTKLSHSFLGILAHAKLGCKSFAQRFAELLGSVTPTPTSQNDQMVRARSVDNFGAWGARHIFEQMRLEDLAYEFVLRAKEGHHESRRRRRGRGSFGRCCTGASARFCLRLVPQLVPWRVRMAAAHVALINLHYLALGITDLWVSRS